MQKRLSHLVSLAALAPWLSFMVAKAQSQVQAKAPGQLVAMSSGVMTIDADSVRLSEILEAIKLKTGAEIEILPGMNEKYVSHLEGEPRAVIAELLSGCGFGYVIMGSSDDPNRISRILFSNLGSGSGTPTRNEAAKAAAATPDTSARSIFLPRSVERGHPSETAPVDTSIRVPIPEASPEGDAPVPAISVGGVTISTVGAQDNPERGVGGDVQSPTVTPGTDSPTVADANTTAGEQKKAADQGENKIGPAGQMLQEMYKARQQLQPTSTPH